MRMFALSLCLVAGAAVPVLPAATLVECSEPALTAAVAAGGEVTFACDGSIPLTSALVITQQVTLDGAGRAVTLSGRGLNRLFEVRTNGSLTLRRLVLADGWTTNLYGGAISNAGVLTLEQCVVTNHTAQFLGPPATPRQAYGGAIYSARGAVVLTGCRLVANTARGQDGVSGATSQGGQGYGGAVFLAGGDLWMTNCLLADNLARAGHGPTNIYSAPGGDAGGGAVFARLGRMGIAGCVFRGNTVESGAGGRNQNAGTAVGGALAVVDNLPVTIDSSTFVGNTVRGGNGWTNSWPYGQGGDAAGGAVYRVPSGVVISNCTFLGNRAFGGSTVTNQIATYGQGRGGAVTGFGLIAFSTIAGNSVASGVGCVYLPAGSGTQSGQALACVYAWNSNASNIELTVDRGFNVSTDSRQFTNVTTLINVDARLGPLADNGGPVPTMALMPGSPALDRVPGTEPGLLPSDARGVPRPAGSGHDVGAFELAAAGAPVLSVSRVGGVLGVTFAGEAGRHYQLLGTENFIDWRTNAGVTLGSNGTVRFEVPVAGGAGVHRVASP